VIISPAAISRFITSRSADMMGRLIPEARPLVAAPAVPTGTRNDGLLGVLAVG